MKITKPELKITLMTTPKTPREIRNEVEKSKWILQRGVEIIGTFDNRFEAVEYLIKMLNQTLKDLKGQDKISSEFDYNIDYQRIQIYQIKIRPAYLGL